MTCLFRCPGCSNAAAVHIVTWSVNVVNSLSKMATRPKRSLGPPKVLFQESPNGVASRDFSSFSEMAVPGLYFCAQVVCMVYGDHPIMSISQTVYFRCH